MKVRFSYLVCFVVLWGCVGKVQAQSVSNVWPDTTINNPYWDQTWSDYDAWAKNNPDITKDYVWYDSTVADNLNNIFYRYSTNYPVDPIDNCPLGFEPWVDATIPYGYLGSIGSLRHVGSSCWTVGFTITIPKLWAPENRSVTPVPGYPFYQVSYELEGNLTFSGSWCWDGTWQASIPSAGVTLKAEFFGGIKARTEYEGYKLDAEVGFKATGSISVGLSCLIKGRGLLWRTGYFSFVAQAGVTVVPFLAKVDLPKKTKCEFGALSSGVSVTFRAGCTYHKDSRLKSGDYSRGGSLAISNFTTPLTFKFQLPSGTKIDSKVTYSASKSLITWGDSANGSGVSKSTEEEIGQLQGVDLIQEIAEAIPAD